MAGESPFGVYRCQQGIKGADRLFAKAVTEEEKERARRLRNKWRSRLGHAFIVNEGDIRG